MEKKYSSREAYWNTVMERKNYGREAYWKNIEKMTVRVTEPDFECLCKLIDLARGVVPLEKFCYQCGLPYTNIARIFSAKRKKGLSVKDIILIGLNLPEGSPVSVQMLFAANGMYPVGVGDEFYGMMKENIRRTRKAIRSLPGAFKKPGMANPERPGRKPASEKLPALPEEKEVRGTGTGTRESAATGGDSVDEGFMQDLCFYARGKSKEDLMALRRHVSDLKENSAFCNGLRMYREEALYERAMRVGKLKSFYENGGDWPKPAESGIPVSLHYKAVLDQMVEKVKAMDSI